MSTPSGDDYRGAWPRLFGQRRSLRTNTASDYADIRHSIKQLMDEYQSNLSHRFQELLLQHELAHSANAESLKRFAQNQGNGSEMLDVLLLEYDRNMQAIRQEIEGASKEIHALSEDARGDLIGGIVRLEEVCCDD